MTETTATIEAETAPAAPAKTTAVTGAEMAPAGPGRFPTVRDALKEYPDWMYLFMSGLPPRQPTEAELAAYATRAEDPDWADVYHAADVQPGPAPADSPEAGPDAADAEWEALRHRVLDATDAARAAIASIPRIAEIMVTHGMTPVATP